MGIGAGRLHPSYGFLDELEKEGFFKKLGG